jgi:GTP-binding protein HflX
MFVSAHTGEGLPELFDRIRAEVSRGDVEVTIAVPFSRGDVVSRIHRDGEVLSTDHDAQGTIMRVRVPAAMAGELAELRVS